MSSYPWFKFRRSEWLSNWRLRACSLNARALWVDVLAATDPDGYVRMPLDVLEQTFRHPIAPLIAELERAGVLHRGTDDLILVRTIARDHQAIESGREGGLKSAQKRGGSKGALEANPSKQRAYLASGSGSETRTREVESTDSSTRSDSDSGSNSGSNRKRKGPPAWKLAEAEFKPKWAALWARHRNGASYAWSQKQDGYPFKQCLVKSAGSIDEVLARAEIMLASQEPIDRKNASPGWLCKRWNSLAPQIQLNGVEHTPDFEAAKAWYAHCWRTTRGCDPVLEPDDDRRLERLLKRLGSLRETKVRVARMIECEDPVVRGWAGLKFLEAHPDRFALEEKD